MKEEGERENVREREMREKESEMREKESETENKGKRERKCKKRGIHVKNLNFLFSNPMSENTCVSAETKLPFSHKRREDKEK